MPLTNSTLIIAKTVADRHRNVGLYYLDVYRSHFSRPFLHFLRSLDKYKNKYTLHTKDLIEKR